MDNNYENEIKMQSNVKCSTGTKIIFYIFGVFCALLALGSLLIIFTTLFGYDKEIVGTVTEVNLSRISEQYEVVVEYSMDGNKKIKTLYIDKLPLGLRENQEIKVKYSSKNKMTYIPKLESISDQIIMFLITATIATVCFMAPHNSKEAANKFLDLRKMVRK